MRINYSILALVICLNISFSGLVRANPIFQFSGDYTGQINGVPIIATATGQTDVTGNTLSHVQVDFTSIPSNISPFALGNSWTTSNSALGVHTSGGALNLFDLSGGNYDAGRVAMWPSLPGDQISVTTHMSTIGNMLNYTADVNGTYNGPTDLVFVTDYHWIWTQLDPTSIEVSTTASLVRANGSSFVVDLHTLYTGLSVQMPTQQQEGRVIFSNMSFSNNIMSYDWQGTLVPVSEPPTLALLSLAALIGLVFRRQRRP
ncbi:putative secreted protein with PEP-CTERM sorting signal/MYXO-CTERM domain-containing protein [Nitrosospira sp. Nsp5]|uniref:PEP-CTERM protein-sorting domain-containing protein/MYXO-CTERM domain-containing protein n=1 Tax=Nitrosospira multiformis TaxID=1231 RepID=A0ABY0T9B1_9PROT|nr:MULTISPECIES: PEP-CTERM sorting domain-containing protein [Nitrosospira]PTR08055.1 putative secreted protein with PEP-CTERM sorting signal/MYXO-CTERM domain-containing protein [Nitrosospira sp. Nsp5]SDQ47844.1 PEP-CTERM protein-sorting domain-containing protein/MYXO-CTERM domain-containing protein [Nitrosospira multiformis]